MNERRRNFGLFGHLINGFALLMRLSGPAFIAFALGLITFGSCLFLTNIIPFYGVPFTDYFATFLFLSAVFITYCIVYNYLMATFSSPGIPPHSSSSTQEEAQIAQKAAQEGIEEHKHQICTKCNRIKVPRVHHCKVCKQCVLKMDHHCIWIANCVGHSNHRFFVMFLFYVNIGCTFWLLFTLPLFTSLSKTRHGDTLEAHQLWAMERNIYSMAMLIFGTVLIFSLNLAIGFLFAWQLYLVLTNQTTIEWHSNRYWAHRCRVSGLPPFQNPYDLGFKRNLRQVLAIPENTSFFWTLIPHTKISPSSGLSFPISIEPSLV